MGPLREWGQGRAARELGTSALQEGLGDAGPLFRGDTIGSQRRPVASHTEVPGAREQLKLAGEGLRGAPIYL